jgi:hypothetical protein
MVKTDTTRVAYIIYDDLETVIDIKGRGVHFPKIEEGKLMSKSELIEELGDDEERNNETKEILDLLKFLFGR